MKKKTLLIIIISILIILLIAGGTFAYLFLATDLFKTDKQLFLKYAIGISNDKNEANILENYENKKKTTAYENSGSFTVNTEIVSESSDATVQKLKNVVNIANNTNIAFSGKVDQPNKKMEENIQINYSDTVNFPFTFKQDGDVYGVKSDVITPNYIAVDNNNLKDLFQKFGVTDVTNVPDKIEAQQLQTIVLTDEEKNHLLNTYLVPMINGISEEKFTKSENSDGSVDYMLTLTYQDIKNIVSQMLETLSTDTMMINKINTILQEIYKDEGILLTTEKVKKAVTNLNNQTVTDGNVTISVTQKDGVTTGMNVSSTDIIIKFSKVQDASSVKYNISLEGNDTNEISFQILYTGLNTNSITENISVTANISNSINIVYSYNNKVTFGNTVNIEAMDMTNTAVLNNYPAEQLQPFLFQLGSAIVQVNTNQMKQIGYPVEFGNPIAMWFTMPTVYQMYNNASSTINNLNKEEIEANNSQYEAFKGEIRGSQVKALCDKVTINNLNGMSNKINVKVGQPATATTFVENVGDANIIKSSIQAGKNYNVTLSYDASTGFVCEIGIEEIN